MDQWHDFFLAMAGTAESSPVWCSSRFPSTCRRSSPSQARVAGPRRGSSDPVGRRAHGVGVAAGAWAGQGTVALWCSRWGSPPGGASW